MTSALYQGSSMGDLLLTAIQRGGDKTAFIVDDRSLTYREFGDLLSRFIQALEQRGLKKGDTVATLSANRPEAFLVTAAAWMMGLCVVALNPTSSEDDHAYMLEDSGTTQLFFDPVNFSDRAQALRHRLAGLEGIWGLGAGGPGEDILAVAAGFSAQRLVPRATYDDVCGMAYTGGTTGKPKGIVHTHRVQVAMVSMELLDWDWPAEIRFLAMTPITHAAGCAIMPTLLRSGTYVMAKAFAPEAFFELVQKHRITATFLVPTMLYVLLDHPAIGQARLESLELILYGAAPMSPQRLIEGLRVFGPVFMQIYGQSEAPMALTVLRKQDHDPERHAHRLASCGTPVIGNQIRLLDDAGQEVPDGEVGEICVRGPLVMQGYWNKPEETAHAFRHGWLGTGDLARRDADGYLYIVDRSKDLIITGGFNVFPREVEDILTQHPAVANAAVIGVADAKWGEAVTGFVMLRAGMSVDAQELIELVKQQKGAVHAPKKIEFVQALALTPLGKLDKKAIRLQYAT